MLNAFAITDAIVEPVTLAQAKMQCRVSAAFTDDDELFGIYIGSARNAVERTIQGSLFNRTWRRSIDNFPLAASYDATISPADHRGWPFGSQISNNVIIDLPGGRARKINSMTYLDGNGATITVDPALYRADLLSAPARLTPANNALCWPWQGQYLPSSVVIEYEIANYTSAIVGEAFTVPAPGAEGTSTYQLKTSWATGLGRLLDGAAAPVSGATLETDAVTGMSALTLPGALAGQALTVDYDVSALPDDIRHAVLMLVAHYYRNPEATTDLNLSAVPFAVECQLAKHVIAWGDYRPC